MATRKLGWMLALMAVACGGPAPSTAIKETPAPPAAPPPTIEQATTIITSAPELSDYQFTRAAYSLPMKRSAMNEPARAAAAGLRKAGWISFSSDQVVLTEKASSDKRFILRQNEVVDIVPLAKKEFIGVTGVRSSAADEPLIDFEWKWIPNEIGALFPNRYDGTQHATATLLRDGSAWVVLRIEERQ